MVGKQGAQAAERNPNWRGGRTVTPSGYVLVKCPGHRLADSRGYVYEQRLVLEEKLGRPLEAHEIAHHINHDPRDNRPENIELMESRAIHCFHHRTQDVGLREPGEPNADVACECGCGRRFRKYDDRGRPRRFVHGHNASGPGRAAQKGRAL